MLTLAEKQRIKAKAAIEPHPKPGMPKAHAAAPAEAGSAACAAGRGHVDPATWPELLCALLLQAVRWRWADAVSVEALRFAGMSMLLAFARTIS